MSYVPGSHHTPPADSTPTVAARVFTYVIPGALISATLSIVTAGFGAVCIGLLSFGGIPQMIRKIAAGEISIKKMWENMDTFPKILAIALAVACVAGIIFASACFFAASPSVVALAAFGAFVVSGSSHPAEGHRATGQGSRPPTAPSTGNRRRRGSPPQTRLRRDETASLSPRSASNKSHRNRSGGTKAALASCSAGTVRAQCTRKRWNDKAWESGRRIVDQQSLIQA